MKLKAILEDTEYDVVIERDSDRLRATIDDRTVEAEITEPEPGIYLLKTPEGVFELITAAGGIGQPTKVHVGDDEYEVTIFDPRKLRGGGLSGAGDDGTVEITSAMPGKIVSIVAAAGDEVAKGEGVIVVEAMKMQNELKSPKDGIVREVLVAEDDRVEAGTVLAVIE